MDTVLSIQFLFLLIRTLSAHCILNVRAVRCGLGLQNQRCGVGRVVHRPKVAGPLHFYISCRFILLIFNQFI